MKHTKGPWIAYDTGNGMRIAPKAIEDALIPNVAGVQNEIAMLTAPKDFAAFDVRWPEIKANAQLIAAAPELLAALKETLKAYQGLDRAATKAGCGDNNAAFVNGYAAAAIAKAEGNSEETK
jgi:hypothetical protein